MVVPTGKRGQTPWRFSIGYKDCEQAFASSVFDFMAHALELGFTELEFCSAKHCMESPF